MKKKVIILNSGYYGNMPKQYPFTVEVDEEYIDDILVEVSAEELINNGAGVGSFTLGSNYSFYLNTEAVVIEE